MEIWTPTQYHAYLAGMKTGPALVTDAPFPVPQPNPPVKLDRYRSKTERWYAQSILDIGITNGIVTRYWYEPFKGLYLAPKTSYTPDFLVEYTDGARPLEIHEVKGGFIRPKDWQKTKQAAAMYPCFRFMLAQWKYQRWWFKEVPPL